MESKTNKMPQSSNKSEILDGLRKNKQKIKEEGTKLSQMYQQRNNKKP